MKHILALTLLLSFSAFAHDGQDGNGPILDVSPAERKACIFLNQEQVGSGSDLLIFEDGGETHYFSRELLKPKCCAIGAITCRITDK